LAKEAGAAAKGGGNKLRQEELEEQQKGQEVSNGKRSWL
jgi:hypothetical protein